MSIKKLILLLFAFFIMVSQIYADENISSSQLLEEIRSLRQTVGAQQEKIDALEKRLLEQEQSKSVISDKAGQDDIDRRIEVKLEERFPVMKLMDGLEMGIGATTILQATNNANGDTETRKKDVADASYSVDLTFSKEFEDYGQAFVHLESGEGNGVEDELKVFSSVNRDTDDHENIRATEVWYEHYFNQKDIPLTISLGKLDPTAYIDDNAYANDETTQFLGRIFRNSPVIEFPDNSFGLRLGYALSDFVDINLLSVDGNSDWEDIFDGMFYAGQLNFKPEFLNREGNYRLIGWLSDQQHTKWLDTPHNKEEGYGFGLSIDQELADTLGLFVRYGWQNPEVYINTASDFSLEQAYSIGLQLKGNSWGCVDDVLGFAFGQIFPSGDYKKADVSKDANSEIHLECYYNYKVNKYLYVSPDLQVIWEPYGGDATDGSGTIVVWGLRGQLDF